MKRSWILALAALTLSVLVPELRSSEASACAAIGRRGPMPIEGEEALIVWDAERRTQHFVRTAAFSGADADFGFLVPTPSRPELAEVAEDVFQRLFEVYRAPPPPAPQRADRSRSRGLLTSAATPPVEVLERRTVAGLDAAVLRANDAGALDAWLARHGYPSSDALRTWLAPYVSRGWIVTAFRIDPGAQRGTGFATRALRMSFQTDTPFFPYSEPASPNASPRPFRVSVVSSTRMRVRAGTAAWSGRVGYADRPGAALSSALRGIVPREGVGAWLTVFDEPRSQRGRDDLFFEPDPSTARTPSVLTAPIVAR